MPPEKKDNTIQEQPQVYQKYKRSEKYNSSILSNFNQPDSPATLKKKRNQTGMALKSDRSYNYAKVGEGIVSPRHQVVGNSLNSPNNHSRNIFMSSGNAANH